MPDMSQQSLADPILYPHTHNPRPRGETPIIIEVKSYR